MHARELLLLLRRPIRVPVARERRLVQMQHEERAKSADLRMIYFNENGFPMPEFYRLRIGPVILRDELEYYREIGLMEQMRVTL